MFKEHKKYFISVGLVAVFAFLSLWLGELTKENSNSADKFLDSADWGAFLGYGPVISILLTLAASALPLFVAFGSKMGKFSKNYFVFLAIWLVFQTIVSFILLTPSNQLGSGFSNSVFEFGNLITPLPLIVGYIMLCVWFGYIIANTAARKGKSWDSFFWLTILLGPIVMWIVTSLLTPEETSARGTVRRSSTWADSTTKQLTASENAFARFMLLISGGILFISTVSMMSDATYFFNDLIGPVSLVSELRIWLLLIELLAFTAFTFSWSWARLFTHLDIQRFTWANIKQDKKTRSAAIVLIAVSICVVFAVIVLILAITPNSDGGHLIENVIPKDGSCAGSISKECGATFVTY